MSTDNIMRLVCRPAPQARDWNVIREMNRIRPIETVWGVCYVIVSCGIGSTVTVPGAVATRIINRGGARHVARLRPRRTSMEKSCSPNC
jgi:hypothetical protein